MRLAINNPKTPLSAMSAYHQIPQRPSILSSFTINLTTIMAGLLDLPVEVRFKIYQHFTKANRYQLSPLYRFPGNSIAYIRDDLTLFRVNRQIRYEAYAILDRVIYYSIILQPFNLLRPFNQRLADFEHDLQNSLQVVPPSSSPRTTIKLGFIIKLAMSGGAWIDYSRWFDLEDLINGNGESMDPHQTSKQWTRWFRQGTWVKKPLDIFSESAPERSLVSGDYAAEQLGGYLGHE